jgi:rpsU-divergently transcribed protein
MTSLSFSPVAAEDMGLSSSIGDLFKDYDLVHYFVMKSNDELEHYLSMTEKVDLREAVEWRLQRVVPYAKGYSEALALIAQPENLQRSTKLLLELADSVAHYALKDKSTDVSSMWARELFR